MSKSIWFSLMLALSVMFGVSNVVQAQETAMVAPMTSVNINQADAQTLSRELQGIGPSKAQAIVDYRAAQGPFTSVDELLEVKGVGVSTLERIRNKLVLE